MKNLFKKLDITQKLGIAFGLWIPVFIQSLIEGWTGWTQVHWYNYIMLIPGFLVLAFGIWRILKMILLNIIKILRKKSKKNSK